MRCSVPSSPARASRRPAGRMRNSWRRWRRLRPRQSALNLGRVHGLANQLDLAVLGHQPAKEQLMHLAACFCRDRGEFVFGEDLVRRLDEDLEILQTKTGKGVVEKCGESGDALGAGETLRVAEVREIRQL